VGGLGGAAGNASAGEAVFVRGLPAHDERVAVRYFNLSFALFGVGDEAALR
jgi:hypothetical protein